MVYDWRKILQFFKVLDDVTKEDDACFMQFKQSTKFEKVCPPFFMVLISFIDSILHVLRHIIK